MADNKSFAVTCKNFFGLLPGERTGEFVAELRRLTAEDKADFIAEFAKIGITVNE